MRLFTSSFNRVLLVLILLFAISVEAGTRLVIPRLSKIERRVRQEYSEARAIRRTAEKKNLLVVGNSLLLTDVKFDAFNKGLGPQWEAKRLSIDNTTFWDWFYGLKSLFRAGSKPDGVVLMLTQNQFLSSGIREDYSAYRLFCPRDIYDLAHDLRLHPTTAFTYFFSSVSAFYGMRYEIRNIVLSKLMQDVEKLTALLVPFNAAVPLTQQDYDPALERMKRLKALADANEVALYIVVPPVPLQQGPSDPVKRAAEDAGIPFIMATPPGTYTKDDYSDWFHLNERGAAHYTPILTETVKRALLIVNSSDAAQKL